MRILPVEINSGNMNGFYLRHRPSVVNMNTIDAMRLIQASILMISSMQASNRLAPHRFNTFRKSVCAFTIKGRLDYSR